MAKRYFSGIYLLALAPAVGIPLAMAFVSETVGPRSTPGIWLMLLGLPGTAVGLFGVMPVGEPDLFIYIATALANWVFYLFVIKGLIALRKTIRERDSFRPSK